MRIQFQRPLDYVDGLLELAQIAVPSGQRRVDGRR